MNKLLNQVTKSVKDKRLTDQNEEKGGFTREIIPEGVYPARFVGWVEIGNRDGGEWKGKKKPPVRKAYAQFEILSKKLAQEIEVNGVKKVIYPVHREMMDVKTGEKANLTKLFRKMAAGRKDLVHIAQMLEEPFRIKFVHNTKEANGDKPEVTYANIRTKDDGWLVMPPTFEKVDEESGESKTVKLKVMEQTIETSLLLWDDPTEEQWASIFIDGTRTKKDKDGSETEVSKNWLQEVCMNEALDFEGSPLHAMLGATELPDMTADEVDEGEEEMPDGLPDDLPEDDEPDMMEGLDDEIPF